MTGRRMCLRVQTPFEVEMFAFGFERRRNGIRGWNNVFTKGFLV